MRKLHEFKCPKCGHEFEDLVDQEEGDPRPECPKCGTKAERIPIAKPTHKRHSSWRVG
jgi:putative FmdB family regulatory protein